MIFRTYTILFFLFFTGIKSYSWGFFAHKKINEMAVFSLPIEMMLCYKVYLNAIKEGAVKPDKRRYVVEGEAPRHYIDMEYYIGKVPCRWGEIQDLYNNKMLTSHGISPWHIVRMTGWLTHAFKRRDRLGVLRLCIDLGHYISDACVPLHTTRNYDGQETGQRGIHGLWESRLPELFSDEYDFFVGKAHYVEDIYGSIWELVQDSHALVEEVLRIEKEIDEKFPFYQKYSFEKRGSSVRKMYSKAYAKAYHTALKGMVEARMRKSILMVASIWYTSWVNAGQPNLSFLLEDKPSIIKRLKKEESFQKKIANVRGCIS